MTRKRKSPPAGGLAVPSDKAVGGRRPGLDEVKKGQVAGLVSVGCSQRMAARYVGCAPATIARTAARDPKFAELLRSAKCSAEVGLLKNIRDAARQPQYWRAAAWMLERGYPQRYAPRGPDVITVDQIAFLLAQFAQIVTEEVPVAALRKRAIRRLRDLAASLTGKPPHVLKARAVKALPALPPSEKEAGDA